MSQYDYSSLTKVQEWSGIPRQTALFNSLFLFQNYPQSPVREQGDRFEIRLDRASGRTNIPLATAVRPGAELSIVIIFDAARFDAAAITRMLGDFQTLLRAIVANPDQGVLRLLELQADARSSSATIPTPQQTAASSAYVAGPRIKT